MKKVKERVKKIADTWFYIVPFKDTYIVGSGKDLAIAYNNYILKKEKEYGTN